MIAWVSPDFTVRSTPRRISLSSTETCRSRISSVLTAATPHPRGRRRPRLVLRRRAPAGWPGARWACRWRGRTPTRATSTRSFRRRRDLAGLDLEVRDRVGPRPVGEDEVAVELVGVGRQGGGTDQHVPDPD